MTFKTRSVSEQTARQILQIYWTDRLTRQALGHRYVSHGLLHRLAQEFGASHAVVAKIVKLKDKRRRFRDINVRALKYEIKRRVMP